MQNYLAYKELTNLVFVSMAHCNRVRMCPFSRGAPSSTKMSTAFTCSFGTPLLTTHEADSLGDCHNNRSILSSAFVKSPPLTGTKLNSKVNLRDIQQNSDGRLQPMLISNKDDRRSSQTRNPIIG